MRKASLLASLTLALMGCVSKPHTPATLEEIQPTPKTNYKMSDYVREGLEDISVVFGIPLETVYSLADPKGDRDISFEDYSGLMRTVQAAARGVMSGKDPPPDLPYGEADEGLKD